MTKEEMIAALDAMLEQGNQLRASELIPILTELASTAAPVNADWNATEGLAEILNKPSIPAAQVQSDWNQNDNSKPDYIKNKPIEYNPKAGVMFYVDLSAVNITEGFDHTYTDQEFDSAFGAGLSSVFRNNLYRITNGTVKYDDGIYEAIGSLWFNEGVAFSHEAFTHLVFYTDVAGSIRVVIEA